jgi:hypothetical protein
VDVELRGLSVFDSQSAYGALNDASVRATVSISNFTSLRGTWAPYSVACAIWQGLVGSSTSARFLSFASCREGNGCFRETSGEAASFGQCLFIGNSVGAISHGGAVEKEDRLTSCFFRDTDLRGEVFWGGSVLIENCLFADAVQSTESFVATGVQVGFTSTEISFDTASLLPTCGGLGGVETPSASPADSRKRHAGMIAGIAIVCVVVLGLVVVLIVLRFRGQPDAAAEQPSLDTTGLVANIAREL